MCYEEVTTIFFYLTEELVAFEYFHDNVFLEIK